MTKEEAMKLKPGDYVLLKSLEDMKSDPRFVFGLGGVVFSPQVGACNPILFVQRYAACGTICQVIDVAGEGSDLDNRKEAEGNVKIKILDEDYEEDPDDPCSSRETWVHWLMIDAAPDLERWDKEVEENFCSLLGVYEDET